jgi:PqqD family protein of HPr-rel-A system
MQRRVAGERSSAPPSRPTQAISPEHFRSAVARAHPVGPTDTWTAVSPAGLCWALWDCDNVVFHVETGETHLLNELPTLLLQMVQSNPRRTTGELCRESAAACDAPADAPWAEKIGSVLRSLENLELIERLPATGA